MKTQITLNPKYIPLFQNDSRYFVVTGGRGSGKSFGVAMFLLNLTYEQGHKVLFTRYTLTAAATSIIPEFVEKIDYSFDENLKDKFIDSISQYWPEINPDKLHPDYTGIRPKITKPNEPMKDFSIQTKKQHGLEKFINLQGIESPGLTSSLAIGKYVNDLLMQDEQ